MTYPEASPYGLDAIDDESAALILQLQEEDLSELIANQKGKNAAGLLSDAQVALATLQEDVEKQNMSIADHHMSCSLTRAVITDAGLLSDYTLQEQRAVNDREMAQNMSEVNLGRPNIDEAFWQPSLDDDLAARLFRLFVSSDEDIGSPPEASVNFEESDHEGIGESSKWGASRKIPRRTDGTRCTVCDSLRSTFQVLKVPCGHDYCRVCLKTLFSLSTTDETLFPPRCCRQDIPLGSARLFLSAELIERFEQKSEEFRCTNRIYCCQPDCSTFILPGNIEGDHAVCPSCHKTTCTLCRSPSHVGDCPADHLTQQVLDMGHQEGWQRCLNCKRLVELHLGCNHIT